jgi:PIN domain nuclease of toxin-antitoxin system
LRLLLDSHFILWLTTDRERLTSAERAAIDKEYITLIVPAVGLWELTIKWNSLGRKGERRLDVVPSDICRIVQRARWEIVPLDAAIAVASLQSPVAHKDPFDTLLLVQAQELGMKLLSRDKKLVGHPLVVTP